MVVTRVVLKRRGKDEAEKPFWISFADLMTALMVLFLVVMGVALMAVTKDPTPREKQEEEHRREVDLLLDRLGEAAARYEGVKIDRERRVIDFGDRARFGFDRSTLAADQESVLRRFTPEILALANIGPGRKLLKRVVVEGYADRTGTYLANLNLSLQRSQRLLCAMFASSGADLLSDAQKEAVRDLFMVGGYSFNASKGSDEESRRVELRLEFLGTGEERAAPPTDKGNFGECSLR